MAHELLFCDFSIGVLYAGTVEERVPPRSPVPGRLAIIAIGHPVFLLSEISTDK